MAKVTSNTSPFDSAWQQLMANGYSVLPVAPNSKAPSEYRAGKWFPMKGWEGFRHDPADPTTLSNWASFPAANIGILTGTKATATHMVACVDYDTDDPDILADLESSLPSSPVRKRGRRGYSAFYLVPLRTKGFRTAIVELLTDTRQTVIPPSIHPDTGQPYVWMGGKTLLNTPAHELPVLSEEDLERFIEQVEASTQKPIKPSEVLPLIQLPDNEQKLWRVINNAAYANLDRWVPDLGLPRCERTSTGSYKTVAHWRASSTGRPLSERGLNLSIMPGQGARDFGTGDSYTAIDLTMRALDLPLDDAVKFLTSRLGMGTERFEVPAIQFEQPVEAPRNPPEIPVSSEEAIFDPATGEVFEEVARTETGKREFSEIPDGLLYPNGLLGEIMDWIVGGARRPSRPLALGSAIGIIGTIAGRAVCGPTRSATHLYSIGLAPSGAGKDFPLQAIKRILTAANLKSLIGPSEFISMPSVINFVQRQPLAICAMDEIGAWLKRLSNKNASSYEQSISKILRSLWGTSFDSYVTPEWAGRAAVEIENPALSLYGASTPEEFFEGLEGADIRNGFLNRFLVFSTNKKNADREPLHDGVVPQELALAVVALRNTLLQLTDADMAIPIGTARPPKTMVWNGGRGVWDAMIVDLERISLDLEREPFFARTAEIAIRLASIHALGCGRMEVERDDMIWGRDIAMWSATTLAHMARDFMSETEHGRLYARFKRAVREAPGGSIKRRDLMRKSFGKDIDITVIEKLETKAEEAGHIEVRRIKPLTGGKPRVSYRWIED